MGFPILVRWLLHIMLWICYVMGVIMIVSLWHLTDIPAALLPKCMSKLRDTGMFKFEFRGSQTSRDLAVRRPPYSDWRPYRISVKLSVNKPRKHNKSENIFIFSNMYFIRDKISGIWKYKLYCIYPGVTLRGVCLINSNFAKVIEGYL